MVASAVEAVSDTTGITNTAVHGDSYTYDLDGNTTAVLGGQNAVQFEYRGVRVIINEDLPTRSTAYYPGR